MNTHLKRATGMIPALAMLACLLAVSPARADLTLPASASIALEETDWEYTLTLPKFDPSLGTLISVQIELHGSITGSMKLSNLSKEADNHIVGQLEATITLAGLDNSPLISVLPSVQRGGDYLKSDDGKALYDNIHGQIWTGLSADTSDSITLTSSADLALFSGPGSIVLPVSAFGTSHVTDHAGNFKSVFLTNAAATATIRYEYTAAVPEPSSIAILGIGGLGLLAMNRHRKNRTA